MSETGMLEAIDCKSMTELIPPYVDGTIARERRGMVAEHLSECTRCFNEAQQFRSMQRFAEDALGPRPISSDFKVKTEQRLRAVPPPVEGEDEEFLEEDPFIQPSPSFLEQLQQRFGAAPWWMISGAFHALVLLLITLIGMAILRNADPEVVIVTDLAEKQEPEELEKPVERDIIPKPVPIENEEITDEMPIVTHEEVEIAEQVETDNDSDANDTRGEDGISDVWLGGSGTVAALGLGGGGGGAFGRPNGRGGRLRRAIRGGGGKGTESAVDAALAWLSRHQEADGRWDYKKYGGGGKLWDTGSEEGITAVALLAFLGAGHTEKIGRYKNNVRACVNWLMSKQQTDGSWGVKRQQEYHVYESALGTLALSESFAMARNPKVGAAAQKGVTYLIGKQEPDGSFPHRPWKSTSSMGWFVMALKSAKVAGLKVPNAAFANALKFMDGLAEKDGDGYYGAVPYAPNKNYFAHKGESMTAVGMVCFQFLGSGGETMKQAEMLAKLPPKWTPGLGLNGEPQNFYHWYYATLGLFQAGGAPWQAWNNGLKSALLPSQCKGGPKDGSLQDVDGSWDPVTLWAKVGGRVWTTAMGALCLEVYYRYLPMYR